MKKERIALFGGAFDPVHLDHLQMAKLCLEADYCDQLWFTPCPDHRWDKKTFAALPHRVEMLKKVIEPYPLFKICLLDAEREEFRGTYVLLKSIQKKHPNFEFKLVIGGDSYHTLPTWRDPQIFTGKNFNGPDLMREFALICFPRQGYELPTGQEHKEAGFLQLDLFEQENLELGSTSSTQVRNEIFLKRPSRGLDPKIIEYIRLNGLYQVLESN